MDVKLRCLVLVFGNGGQDGGKAVVRGLSWGEGVRGCKLGSAGRGCRDACVRCKSQNYWGWVEIMVINSVCCSVEKLGRDSVLPEDENGSQ